MGKARDINNLEKQDMRFAEFMKRMEQQMDADSVKYLDEFYGKIESFYMEKRQSFIQIAEGKHFDYQLETKFSMENISRIVKMTSKETFKSLGTEEEGLTDILTNYEELAAKIAIYFFTKILASLTMKQTAEYNIQQISVAPGITLHLLIVQMYYDGDGFFGGNRIIQSFICYKLCFSKDLVRVEAEAGYLKECLKEIKSNNKVIETMRAEKTKLLLDSAFRNENPDGPLHIYLNHLVSMISQLENAYEEAFNCMMKM